MNTPILFFDTHTLHFFFFTSHFRLISFMKKYLDRPAKDFFSILKEELLPINAKVLFVKKTSIGDKHDYLQISRQPELIKTFLIIYFGYLKETIFDRLLSLMEERFKFLHFQDNIIGYTIHAEKRFLDDVVGSKQELEEMVIAGGILGFKEYNPRRTLIFSQGEGLLPILQKKFKLSLALKSYYLQAQLQEDYLQFTLYQVVVKETSTEEAAAIIIQDDIIQIENIYESVCKRIWKIIDFCGGQGKNGELLSIDFCDSHKKGNDASHAVIFTSICSLKNYQEVLKSVKNYLVEAVSR